ncbi:MAG: GIY-YIG nuclease family protein, partial [Burkholderiales bacterium]
MCSSAREAGAASPPSASAADWAGRCWSRLSNFSSSPRRRGPSDLEKAPCVYILASKRNGTLYVGVTSDLVKRIYEHKHDLADGFTKKYRIHDLVYFEPHE